MGRSMKVGLAMVALSSMVVAAPARADFLVCGGTDKTIKVFMTPDYNMIKSMDNGAAITSITRSPDGKLCATGGADGKIKLWKATDGSAVGTIDAGSQPITTVFFTSDSKRLLSGSADKSVKIWDVAGAKLVKSVVTLDGPAVGIMATPEYLIVGGTDGEVKIYDPDGENSIIQIPTAHEGGLTAMMGDPNKAMLYTGGKDGKLKFWSQDGSGEFDGGQGSEVKCIAVLKDGTIISGGADGKIKLWDGTSHKATKTLDAAHPGGVTCITVTPDGKSIISAGADKKIKIWNADGTVAKTLDAGDGTINVIAYFPAGTPTAPAAK
jgi:WD40 repeat protein